MEPIFQTSMLGTKTSVFPTHLEFKILFSKKTIPLESISSIENLPGMLGIKVITNSGEKVLINVGLKDKENLINKIYEAKNLKA